MPTHLTWKMRQGVVPVEFRKVMVFLLWGSMIVLVDSAKYCNFGRDITSPLSFKNQSCSTGELHLLNPLLVPNERMILESSQELSTHQPKGNNERELVADTSANCFIFRYIERQLLDLGVKKESVHVEFGCDSQNVCFDKEMDTLFPHEVYNGSVGQLFCCDGDNCNTVDKLPHLPAENRVCYHGNDSQFKTDNEEDVKESCAHPDVMCVKLTRRQENGSTWAEYFCDNDMKCQMLGESLESCHLSPGNGTQEELCCCDRSLCYQPPWLDQTNVSKPYSSPTHPSSINKPGMGSYDRMVITGIVAAAVVIISFLAGILVALACKRRQRPRPDPNVIVHYERLSSCDPDVTGAVVL